MEVGVPAPGDAGDAAEVVGQDPLRRQSPDQVAPEIPVHGGDDVVGAERIPRPHGDGLVALAAEGAADASTLFPQRHDPVVEGAGEHHPAVQVQLGLRRRC